MFDTEIAINLKDISPCNNFIIGCSLFDVIGINGLAQVLYGITFLTQLGIKPGPPTWQLVVSAP